MDQKTILLIEDDKFLYDLYKKVLAEAGFLVEVADDGEKGLAAAKSKKYDLVLLDIMLPKKNGVDVLKELKASNTIGKTSPVIVLSNLGQDDIIKQCLGLGAIGYLIKVENLPQEIVRKVSDFITPTI